VRSYVAITRRHIVQIGKIVTNDEIIGFAGVYGHPVGSGDVSVSVEKGDGDPTPIKYWGHPRQNGGFDRSIESDF
jgi:hypothetical protein